MAGFVTSFKTSLGRQRTAAQGKPAVRTNTQLNAGANTVTPRATAPKTTNTSAPVQPTPAANTKPGGARSTAPATIDPIEGSAAYGGFNENYLTDKQQKQRDALDSDVQRLTNEDWYDATTAYDSRRNEVAGKQGRDYLNSLSSANAQGGGFGSLATGAAADAAASTQSELMKSRDEIEAQDVQAERDRQSVIDAKRAQILGLDSQSAQLAAEQDAALASLIDNAVGAQQYDLAIQLMQQANQVAIKRGLPPQYNESVIKSLTDAKTAWDTDPENPAYNDKLAEQTRDNVVKYRDELEKLLYNWVYGAEQGSYKGGNPRDRARTELNVRAKDLLVDALTGTEQQKKEAEAIITSVFGFSDVSSFQAAIQDNPDGWFDSWAEMNGYW